MKQQEPPLVGRWHHGNGVLVSGSIRIARWDCDTNPPQEFQNEVLDWACATLNAAIAAALLPSERTTSLKADAPEQAELIATLCARIKAADDAASDNGYMLDSNDCIAVLRGTWAGPLANDCPPTPRPAEG